MIIKCYVIKIYAKKLEQYNGLLLKMTQNKKILTWDEYINLIINEEQNYKLKIISLESNNIRPNKIEDNFEFNDTIKTKFVKKGS